MPTVYVMTIYVDCCRMFYGSAASRSSASLVKEQKGQITPVKKGPDKDFCFAKRAPFGGYYDEDYSA